MNVIELGNSTFLETSFIKFSYIYVEQNQMYSYISAECWKNTGKNDNFPMIAFTLEQ